MESRWRLSAARWAAWISPSAATSLSAYRNAYPTPVAQIAGLRDALHNYALESYFFWMLALSALTLVALGANAALSSESRVRIKALLDALASQYFAGPDEERFKHRVTLFKANKARTRLEPHCRSGNLFQKSKSAFRIDDENPEHNEGVAGRAWSTNSTVVALTLTEPCEPWNSEHGSCSAYAEEGYLSVGRAGRLKVKSLSILATPVRNFAGARWGVLVIDSAKAGSIVRDREHDAQVTLIAAAIAKMV